MVELAWSRSDRYEVWSFKNINNRYLIGWEIVNQTNSLQTTLVDSNDKLSFP